MGQWDQICLALVGGIPNVIGQMPSQHPKIGAEKAFDSGLPIESG